jgi:hypothetical protein
MENSFSFPSCIEGTREWRGVTYQLVSPIRSFVFPTRHPGFSECRSSKYLRDTRVSTISSANVLRTRAVVMTDQNRSKVIQEHPIGNGLNAFRTSFNSICEDRNISPDPAAVEHLGQEGTCSKADSDVSLSNCMQTYRILSSSFSPHYRSIQPLDCSVQAEMAKPLRRFVAAQFRCQLWRVRTRPY